MAKINKDDLIGLVSEQTGKSKKDIKEILESTINVIEHKVARGDEVNIFGFLNFKNVFKKGRDGFAAMTKTRYTIPDRNICKVTVLGEFEKIVDKK